MFKRQHYFRKNVATDKKYYSEKNEFQVSKLLSPTSRAQ